MVLTAKIGLAPVPMLIWVKLRVTMGDQTDLTMGFLAARWSRGCAGFCTALWAALISK